jgi:glutathione S-transferase
MGDIPIGAEVQRWIRLPMERPQLPNLEAWFERLSARPAFKKHVDLPLT